MFANPRNVAAGSVRQLDPAITRARKLDSFIYDIASIDQKSLETQEEELKLLQKLGFKVNPHFKRFENIDEVIKYWKQWEEKRERRLSDRRYCG